MNWKKAVAFAAIFLVASYILLLIAVYQHEKTHAEIFRIAGVDAEIKMSWLGGETTAPHVLKDFNNVYLAQSIVEIIGYQVLPFLLLIFLVALLMLAVLICIFFELREMNERDFWRGKRKQEF